MQNPGKRLKQAELLCSLDSENMAPFIAAAALNARLKNIDQALSFLKLATSKTKFLDRTTRWESLIAGQYTDAGRSPDQTAARMALQRSQVEVATVMQLAKSLQVSWEASRMTGESIDQNMSILAIYQQLADSSNFELTSRSVALGQEFNALTAIHQSSNTSDFSNYLAIPVETAVMQSEKELAELRKLGALRTKSAEAYEQLAIGDRGEFLKISKESGQVSALRWIWENRPQALVIAK